MAIEPLGRYLAGPSFVHFCARPQLWGVLLWGAPDEEDTLALARSLALELAPPAVPHVSVVDARFVERADTTAFASLERYVRERSADLSRQVLRLAILRPSGMAGAVVSGFYDVTPQPYPVEVFEEPRAAQLWLDDATAGLGDLEGLLADLHARVRLVPTLVRALRQLLDEHLPHPPPIRTAAQALGVSDRTLQRRLAETRTTFQDEVAASRIRAAKRLLAHTDASLTTIALDVGYASLQHFGSSFRKIVGQSPSSWRQDRRLA